MSKNIELYRGAKLTSEQIATYQDLATRPDEYRSFQAFTSCSQNPNLAEQFGNALFIMKVEYAFTVDLSPISKYPGEAEELITPGVCFSVERIEFDNHKKKHFIHLKLRQRFARKHDEVVDNFCEMIMVLSKVLIQIFFVANLSLSNESRFELQSS
jgi:hypothetical protein